MSEDIYTRLYNLYNNYINDSSYVYTSFQKEWIIILKLLDESTSDMNRKDIFNPLYAKYITNKVQTILIFNKFDITKTKNELSDGSIIFQIDKITQSDCVIYFYKSIMRAYLEELNYNELDGVYITYHPNGQIKRKFKIEDGKLNGVSLKYHDNGVIQCIEKYKNNKLHGNILEYNNYGLIIFKYEYDEGVIKKRYIYQNGILVKTIKERKLFNHITNTFN